MQLPPLFYNLIKLFIFLVARGLFVADFSEAALTAPFNCGKLDLVGVAGAFIWPSCCSLSVRRSEMVTLVMSFLCLEEKVGFM